MPCCSCMSSGKCRKCSCVKDGMKCEDCRPSRRLPSRCENSTANLEQVTTLRINYLLILSQILIMLHLSGMISLSIDSSINNNNNFTTILIISITKTTILVRMTIKVQSILPPFTTMSPPTFVWSEKTLFSQSMLHMMK